jgi:hypothetical protein
MSTQISKEAREAAINLIWPVPLEIAQERIQRAIDAATAEKDKQIAELLVEVKGWEISRESVDKSVAAANARIAASNQNACGAR